MTDHQQFVAEFIDGFKASRTVPAEVMPLVDRLQERLSMSADIEQVARAMYTVQGAEDLSIGLLWAMSLKNQSGNGNAMNDEVMQRLYAGLDRLFGLETAPTFVMPPAMPVEESPASSIPQMPEESTQPQTPPQSAPIMQESVPAVQESGPASVESLGAVMEKFIESIQAGSDDRAQLLDDVQAQCAGLGAVRNDDASLNSYLTSVSDFLSYIKTNDLLDDIRVMNIVTNFQEPYAQWMLAPEGSREGILEQAVEFLADFRAMFE